MITLGAAWAHGGWYIYSDLTYSNILHRVGGFGANGNDKWNYRFNINFGYYF